MVARIKTLLLSSTSKDTFITLIGNGLVALGGMLFTVFVARALSPELFGIFSALFALAALFGSLADLGISSALVNFLPKLKDKRGVIISVTFWMQLAIAIVLFFITIGLIPIKNIVLPGSTIDNLIILAFVSFIISFNTFAQGILKAEKKFTWVTVVISLDSWSKLIFTVILFFSDILSVNTVLLATLASSSLATAVGLSRELKNIRPIFPKSYASQIFHYAKWIAIMRAFSVAIARVDVILLNALSSSFQAGIFAAAGRVALLFSLLVGSLGSVVAPRFSGFNHKLQVSQYLKKLVFLIGGISLLMIISIIFAPLIINLVFGAKYLPAIPVFRALTLAMIPFLLSIITTNPLIYTFNQPNFVAAATVVQVVILVALDFVFIPKFGAMGPTYSLAISNTIVLALTGYKLKTLLS